MSNMQTFTASAVALRNGATHVVTEERIERLRRGLVVQRELLTMLAAIRPSIETERDIALAMREVGL